MAEDYDEARRRKWHKILDQTGQLVLSLVGIVAGTGIIVWGAVIIWVGMDFIRQYALPVEKVWFPDARMEKIEAFVTGVGLAAISFIIREWHSRK